MRRILPNLILIVVSFSLFVVLAEAALRIFPDTLMPKGTYGSTAFDPDTKLKVHDGPLIYNKVRYVERVPNNDGFMDVNHDVPKSPDTYRIGFFGDSYVESIHVPLGDTFFRRIPEQVGNRNIETFGIGVSGLGTLHSLLNYKKFGNKYDHDLVIYVFVKNDPGDHLGFFRAGDGIPYAVPADYPKGYTLVVDDGSWQDQHQNPSLAGRVAKVLSAHSLFARMLKVQLRLARITWRRNQQASKDPESGNAVRTTNQNDLPTQWPPDVLADAKTVTAAVLSDFSEEVAQDGRDFAVLFVPRLHGELEGQVSGSESWLPWLSQTCEELGIRLLNPLPLLTERRSRGETIYDDHWSTDGHRAIAEFMTDFIAIHLDAKTKVSVDAPPE